MSDPVIRIQGATKTFKTGFRRTPVTAVSNLDMIVERGSVVAFIGPNGAGKTTTIFMLLGLLEPDRGTIEVFGQAPGSEEARSRLGFMSEIFHTYPFHTAKRAVAFYGRLSGLSPGDERESRISEHLARVGLGNAVERKVGTFSKGMTQRLGLAQALFHEPDLLLLDEPTTGLDPEGRLLVSELIAEEQEKGTTVFLSSHILSDVERNCDTVIMIRDGKTVMDRSLEELRAGSDRWIVEVPDLPGKVQERLVTVGFGEARELNGIPVLDCSSATKTELLSLLINSEVDIGEVRNTGQTLEDLYMTYVEED